MLSLYGLSNRRVLMGAAILVLAFGLALGPLGLWLNPSQQWAAALILLAIGFWAGQILPDAVVALIFMCAVLIAGIARPEQAFAGFLSGANWLIFAGIVVGLAIRHVGLNQRLAAMLLALAPRRYEWTVLAAGLTAFAAAFIIPSSMGRIVILVPIAVALADALGYRPGDPGRTGIVITVGAAAYYPSFGILPAGLPNVIIYGAAESLYGLRFTYGEWLLLNGLVVGLLKTLVLIASALILFRPLPRDAQNGAGSLPPAGSFDEGQRKLLIVLGLTIAFWASDAWHGVSPAWIGLAAACLLIFPGLNLTPKEPFKALDLAPFFYVAGVLSIGAVVAETGLGSVTALHLIDLFGMRGGEPELALAKLIAMAFILGLCFTIGAAPAVFGPLAGDLAQAIGLPLDLVLSTQLIGISSMIFPYQGPPLVVAAMLGGVGAAATLRFCFLQGVISLLLLTPAQIGWWHLLDRIPG